MYNFFNKHRVLRALLDWTVLMSIPLALFYLFGYFNFKNPFFVIIYVNVFILLLLLYVDLVHCSHNDRMNVTQWMDNIRWINVVCLILHFCIGFYKKRSHEIVVDSIWSQSRLEIIILTLLVYLSLIIIPSFIIYIIKKKWILINYKF